MGLMHLVKRFLVMTANMIAELWMGFYRRNSDFYDKQTSGSKSKTGYYVFVITSAVVAVGVVSWMYNRMYS
ncbi:hypothetical protein N6H13_03560 [Paenibacillus sp. CC-CFT742]|nr:hypothetical protein [Paenibacillus sp. CC-CFT742]WJH29846.1 hypothetical protein N6H13_03560 [Paenibacillus sp. CC-CFT742]